jgi:hypothetical protein
MEFEIKKIEKRIRELMLSKGHLTENDAKDIAFHLTDWLDEMLRFAQFCNKPEKWNEHEIEELLCAFLTHVPNHLAAASKLFTGLPVTDIFGVGAVEMERDNS